MKPKLVTLHLTEAEARQVRYLLAATRDIIPVSLMTPKPKRKK